MCTPEILNDLWEELAAPSALAFTRALARRDIKARVKDVEAFVASKSENRSSHQESNTQARSSHRTMTTDKPET